MAIVDVRIGCNPGISADIPAGTPWLIAAKKDLPADDLRGLIAWLKANPDKASLGTAGVGSPSHLGGVLFQNLPAVAFVFSAHQLFRQGKFRRRGRFSLNHLYDFLQFA